jgi:hypothetical protein
MFRLLFLLVLTQAALALEIKQTRWGFDGKAMPERFNILSVLVAQEPGGKPFDGELVLTETRGTEQAVGAPLVQTLYLTPGTERWVQFVPFVTQEYEWRLRWGRGDKAVAPVPAPKLGPPAAVVLLDLASVFAPNLRLPGFPENLFPTNVAATDALDQVVLDHVPRWDAPRREAFLDWVRRGGLVHVLRGPEGFPNFDGDLSVLNIPPGAGTDALRVGAGRVLRHEIERADFDATVLHKAGYPLREFQKQDNEYGNALYRFDQTMLQNLASLTRPQVQWWLLYLLTIAYLLLIGPGHYFWSRKVDWRMALGGFLGLVAAFALAFIIAGHRGSGENQTSHALAIARSLGGTRWDVQEWVSAFATRGDYYKLTHTAPANFYAVPSDGESVSAKAFGGKEGHLEADIPLYSARPFMHRAVMAGPNADIKVVEWKKDSLVLELPADFPLETRPATARFLSRMTPLTRQGRRLTWSEASGTTASSEADFVSSAVMNEFREFDASGGTFKPNVALSPMFAHFLGNVKALPHPLTSRFLLPDHLQLFIFAETPESFAMKGKGFDHGRGHALYVIDVFRPAAANP